VLISEFFRHFRLRQYLARYTREPVAMVDEIEGLGDMFCEEYYDGLAGGFLEGLGQLFPADTIAYIYPQGDSGSMALDDMPVADDVRPLLEYLHARGHIVLVEGYDSFPG